MTNRKLSKQQALDLVTGAKILACGGGGSVSEALHTINEIYSNDKYFLISDLNDFKPNDYLCIIGMVGGGVVQKDMKLVEGLETINKNAMVSAVEELEEFLGVEFQGFVATELGPYNSIIPISVAAQMNKIAINGDCCGRSKPKISISTTNLAEISIFPFAMVNQYGEIQIVKKAVSDTRAEIIARNAARISGGSVSVARCPMTIQQATKAVIPNTFSKAIKLGQKVREANENKKDYSLEAIREVLPEIKLIFKGKVKDFSRFEEGGFTSGEITLYSVDDKKELRIWYQNEYLLSWLNNKRYVTCPDGLYVVDAFSGYGLTPWEDDFIKGRQVAVFTSDAASIWHSEKGLEIFGPRAFDKKWEEYKKASSFS
jgi:DUF917 family protein